MSDTIADPIALGSVQSADTDETRFILGSRVEITYVLRDLVRMRALASIHFSGAQDMLLTPLLAVDTANSEIVFDCSGSEEINQGVLRASKLLFSSSQDKVKIRFSTPGARRVTKDGRDAFAAPIPEAMLRLQRRDYFRALAPLARPVKCIFAVDTQDGRRDVETRLHDISEGGVAVVTQPGEIAAQIGARYSHCRITLPETGNVVATLEVRSILDMPLLNGKSAQRLGCQFVRPSVAASSLIQRYLMKLERERAGRK